MIYRKLGRSGVEVSVLSLGSWMNFGERISDDVAEATMMRAYEAGVNFFDNAEVYAGGRSEEVMGAILKRLDWNRSTYLVSSKVFWGGSKPNQTGLSRKHIVEACHAALKRLQVDYLDLFFCHRADLHTPVEETVSAMTDLIRQGKVLYWGTSEWPVARIMAAHEAASAHHLAAPVMEQPQYNMLVRDRFEREYQQLFALKGSGATIWSPLASGLLTDAFVCGEKDASSRFYDPKNEWLKKSQAGQAHTQNPEALPSLAALAADSGMSFASLSLAWTLKNLHVSTAIMGATSIKQLDDNLKAVSHLDQLTPDIMDRIDAILGNAPCNRDWLH